MATTVIDAKGQPCPKPVVMTRRALAEIGEGEELVVVLDNETSKDNVVGILCSQGVDVHVSGQDGVYRVVGRKTARTSDAPQPQIPCQTLGGGTRAHVICVKSNRMGIGDDELGDVLMRAFVNVLDETSLLPLAMVLYNSGIMLALKDSPVLESLQKLERGGIRILVCGTCLNHFKQKDNIAVGTISNMYDIAETLSRAGHVVYP